jgi:hypothetical protein
MSTMYVLMHDYGARTVTNSTLCDLDVLGEHFGTCICHFVSQWCRQEVHNALHDEYTISIANLHCAVGQGLSSSPLKPFLPAKVQCPICYWGVPMRVITDYINPVLWLADSKDSRPNIIGQ